MRLPRPTGLPWRIPEWAWKRLKLPGRHPQAGPHKLPAWFWTWRIWRLGHKPRQPIVMYDDVNVSLIPADAEAVAGYVGGRWPTYQTLVKEFPHAHKLSIAVTASEDADCLDVEPGDATIADAPAWVKRQHARGISRLPVLYTSASQGQHLIDSCTQAGLDYGKDYLWWSAHYTFQSHFCGPGCGFGIKETAHATQWTDKSHGRSLDESICNPEFFA